MTEAYDIKTLDTAITDTNVDLGIGAVASGMKRYILTIGTTNTNAVEEILTLFEGTDATDETTTKLTIQLQNKDVFFIGDNAVATNVPLFTIDAETYLTAKCTTTGARLFVRYYDR